MSDQPPSLLDFKAHGIVPGTAGAPVLAIIRPGEVIRTPTSNRG